MSGDFVGRQNPLDAGRQSPGEVATRIAVIGTSGSGKSTLATVLGRRLGAPRVELDAINWQRGWRDLNTEDPDEFKRRVEQAIAGERWVTDGNYGLVLPRILARATDVVWLDYSRWVTMNRVIRRSVVRAWTGQELWAGTGNRENFRRWLDPDHPIRWAWDTFANRRKRYEAMLADLARDTLAVHRLRAPAEAVKLIETLSEKADSWHLPSDSASSDGS